MFGGEGGKGAGEVEDFDPVYTEDAEQFLLFFQRVEQAEFPGAVLEDGPGMRLERDNEGLVSARMRQGDEPLYHETVPEVDTVKKACGRNHGA